jgi:hypothetical protein
MTANGTTPADFDAHTPSPARMYNFYLRGKDNFEADRQAAKQAVSVVPDSQKIAWSNRRFLLRAVKYMAGQGIDQFIDLGPGIPIEPYVHEMVQGIVPAARVAYIDNDPIVTSHNRSLLACHNRHVLAMHGDVRCPQRILLDGDLNGFIDFTRPVGVLLVAVLHFLTDWDDPSRTVRVFRDRVPPGSYVAISHITSDGTQPNVISAIQDAYAKASAPAVFRSRAEIEALFGGLELVPPGLAEVSDWRREHLRSAHPSALRVLAGIGRKL